MFSNRKDIDSLRQQIADLNNKVESQNKAYEARNKRVDDLFKELRSQIMSVRKELWTIQNPPLANKTTVKMKTDYLGISKGEKGKISGSRVSSKLIADYSPYFVNEYEVVFGKRVVDFITEDMFSTVKTPPQTS